MLLSVRGSTLWVLKRARVLCQIVHSTNINGHLKSELYPGLQL